MPIDKKLIKRLKPGFDYLEEYDRYGKKPNKRVPVCVTIIESMRGLVVTIVLKLVEGV